MPQKKHQGTKLMVLSSNEFAARRKLKPGSSKVFFSKEMTAALCQYLAIVDN